MVHQGGKPRASVTVTTDVGGQPVGATSVYVGANRTCLRLGGGTWSCTTLPPASAQAKLHALLVPLTTPTHLRPLERRQVLGVASNGVTGTLGKLNLPVAGAPAPSGPIQFTLWVATATHLPVQMTLKWNAGSETLTFSHWNDSHLQVTPPPGSAS